MEIEDMYHNKAEYVETASGNKVSRHTVLCGSQNIVLHGKVIVQSHAIIRGDLANVRMGRYCIISKNAIIRPPFKKFSKGIAFFPLSMGNNVFVGERAVVNAAIVGSYVYIGKDAVIGRRCILKDCCYIEDGAVVPPETILPSFTRVAGSPARCVEDLPDYVLLMEQYKALCRWQNSLVNPASFLDSTVHLRSSCVKTKIYRRPEQVGASDLLKNLKTSGADIKAAPFVPKKFQR